MSHKSFNPPKGWGSDLLSQFQSTAMENEFATFVHAPEWQGMLCEVATILDSCSSYAMERLPKANDPALLLFVCAQSQYLASVRSTAAGHCIAAYPTGRSAVESALYGWHLANNPTASQNWHNKPEPDQKKALRDWNEEFKFSSLARSLGKRINRDLEEWAKYLHQTAIDLGAHPNQNALYANMEYEDREDGACLLKITHLHIWNDFSMSTTKFTIETGMFVIRLFALSFHEANQQLDLNNSIDRLVKSLKYLQSLKTLETE
ncbi:hypothetical protein [Methylomonas fluvii]|uniref:Uncharacterized protein n=1 Tax=Methylomonas fluvii TaxID=1854564 RepID=A0ABR9DAT2_9GAMM|nr:hypothetical protein [Methylomonas fluvii]MBD9360199.1 hypothetical protein [Methylomonas fluvii]